MKMRVLGATLLLAVAVPACDGPIDAVGLSEGSLRFGLVAHWAFDEGSETTVGDGSGNDHAGTIQGTTWSWLDEGRFSSALHLEQGDHVTVDDFPAATAGWTVAAWVRVDGANMNLGEVTVVSTENVFRGGWEVNINAIEDDPRYHFGFWSGPGSYDYAHVECVDCLEPDRWQHIAIVVDGSARTAAFYLGGRLHVRGPIPTPISPGVSTLYMGKWATDDPPRLFAGDMDDIAIWNRPLASMEIELLQTAPVP